MKKILFLISLAIVAIAIVAGVAQAASETYQWNAWVEVQAFHDGRPVEARYRVTTVMGLDGQRAETHDESWLSSQAQWLGFLSAEHPYHPVAWVVEAFADSENYTCEKQEFSLENPLQDGQSVELQCEMVLHAQETVTPVLGTPVAATPTPQATPIATPQASQPPFSCENPTVKAIFVLFHDRNKDGLWQPGTEETISGTAILETDFVSQGAEWPCVQEGHYQAGQTPPELGSWKGRDGAIFWYWTAIADDPSLDTCWAFATEQDPWQQGSGPYQVNVGCFQQLTGEHKLFLPLLLK